MNKYDCTNCYQSFSVREIDRGGFCRSIKIAHDSHPICISRNSKDYVVIVKYEEYLKLIKKGGENI